MLLLQLRHSLQVPVLSSALGMRRATLLPAALRPGAAEVGANQRAEHAQRRWPIRPFLRLSHDSFIRHALLVPQRAVR